MAPIRTTLLALVVAGAVYAGYRADEPVSPSGPTAPAGHRHQPHRDLSRSPTPAGPP